MTSTELKFNELKLRCATAYSTMIQKPLQPITVSALSTIARGIYEYVSLFDSRPENFYDAHLSLLRGELVQIKETISSLDPVDFVKSYTKAWSEWLLSSRRINATVTHFNNVWRPKLTPRPGASVTQATAELYDFTVLSELTWKIHIFEPLASKLISALVELITRDRDNGYDDKDLIRTALQSFVRLGINSANVQEPTLEVYSGTFLPEFLKRTRIYYTLEARLFVERSSILEYVKHATARIKLEEARVQAYLHPETRQPLIDLLVDVLIKDWLEPFNLEFKKALEIESLDNLSNIYYLLRLLPGGTDSVFSQLEKWIVKMGQDELLTLTEGASQKETTVDPKSFVCSVLKVYRHFRDMISATFGGDVNAVAALDKATRLFMNVNAVTVSDGISPRQRRLTPPTVAPRLLATYADLILRKGTYQIKDEKELETELADIVSLFRYLPDKDIFMVIYARLLSKRLLTDASASEDAEAFIVRLLKQEQGFEHTQKLIKMISDIQISKDLNEEFQTVVKSHPKPLELGFSVYVIETGSWPISPPSSAFNLPAIMERPLETFQSFYDGRHRKRKLVYLHDLARVEVDRVYPVKNNGRNKIIRLNANGFQAGVMLLFAGLEETEVTLKYIIDVLGFTDETARGMLYGLVKTKMLLADSGLNPTEWTPDTKFSLNTAIPKIKSGRLNVNLAWTPKTKPVIENKELELSRNITLRAWIVKLMKARSSEPNPVMTHSSLLTGVTEATKKWFLAQPAVIKKAIEGLIQEEYLERKVDESGAPGYVYLA